MIKIYVKNQNENQKEKKDKKDDALPPVPLLRIKTFPTSEIFGWDLFLILVFETNYAVAVSGPV